MLPLRDDRISGRFPLFCVLVIVLNVVVFLYEQALGDEGIALLFLRAGVVPHFFFEWDAAGKLDAVLPPLTLLSSSFLHAGWLHLLGNIWFLWVFGDNVEAALGPFLFLPFYLFCAAVAAGFQILSDPYSFVPMVGASGAIAGVLGAYLVLYPTARVDTLVLFVFYVRILRLPAALYLGLWFVLQLTGLVGSPEVAWWAHIGGFLAGAVVGMLLRLFRGREDDLIIDRPVRRARRVWRSGKADEMMIRLPRRYR